MGFMDKLKNIFFEEEEEEEVVENTPKQEEPIARKVEVPKRQKEEVFESKKEEVKEIVKPKEEDNYIEIKKAPIKQADLFFEDEDFILDTKPLKKEKEVELYSKKVETNIYKSRETKDLYKNEYKTEEKKEPPKYEYSYQKEVKPVEKTFTPSPIISPIYGILDKNYKKEEIKEKKEIRISSRPSKMDLDTIRNKAFGDLEYDLFDNTPTKEDLEEKEQEKLKKEEKNREYKKIYDMTDNSKPSIEKVTIAEADEYFNDLGLAYNTDYKDISKEINDGRFPYEKKQEKGDKLEDNLFDLIESMYDKED